MSIRMKFSSSIKAFNQPVVIETYGAGYNEEGIYEEQVLATKTIKAIILMLSLEQLQILKEGATGESGISIITKEPLNFVDNRYPNKNGINKQDYVIYGGYKYKVTGTGILEFNSNCYCYTALRFLK